MRLGPVFVQRKSCCDARPYWQFHFRALGLNFDRCVEGKHRWWMPRLISGLPPQHYGSTWIFSWLGVSVDNDLDRPFYVAHLYTR